MLKKIILIGAGGHALSCIDVLESTKQWEILGLLDRSENVGKKVLNYLIIGSDDDIQKFGLEGNNFLIAIGQIENNLARKSIYQNLKNQQYKVPTIIANSAHCARGAKLGDGISIMHRTFINNGAQIGENSIINTGAIIEHGVILGKHCHISTNAVVNGDCVIGDDCFIGSGAVIKHRINIASGTVIGAGAVVIKDISHAGTYVGNPAHEIRNR